MSGNVTRRQAGFLLGSLGIPTARAQEKHPGTTIHQEIDFKAAPSRIYEVLLDSKQFGAFTGGAADIQAQPGGVFKLFDGAIEGRNIELIPNQRIVQAWRPGSWPAGVYSIVKFELMAHGSGSRVLLDHAGFSEDKQEHLRTGWHSHYWEPLHKYLNE